MASETVTRVRGPYRSGIKRRREIIEAAASVFGRFGYAGGSLRQIAKEVGVTPAALTRHFENKEGLLLAVLDYWDVETDRLLFPHQHGLDRFKHLPDSVYAHTLDRGLIEMFLTIAAEASNPSHPANGFIRRRYERVVQSAIDELTLARETGEILPMSDAEIEVAVRGAYALMDGIQLQWLLNPSVDVVAAFKRCLGYIISGWTGVPMNWDEVTPLAQSVPIA